EGRDPGGREGLDRGCRGCASDAGSALVVGSSQSAVRRRKHWGWGYEDEQPSREEVRAAADGFRAHLGFGGEEVEEPVPLEQVELPPGRLEPPALLAEIC